MRTRCGIVALLLLPVLAKNTYISENALMPGSAEATFSEANALDASTLADEVKSLAAQSTDTSMAIQKWLISNLEALGADSYLHPFMPSGNPFDAVRFFSTATENVSRKYQWQVGGGRVEGGERTAINVVGILRAPRGEGHDAIVLVTPLDLQNLEVGDALALGLGMEVFGLLSRAFWLSKDIIWLVADSRFGSYAAVSAWLKEYYEPVLTSLPLERFSVLSNLCEQETPIRIRASCGISSSLVEGSYTCCRNTDDLRLRDFKRAGNIAAAIVMELRQGNVPGADYLQVRGEGVNGQMPNLDLVNVCNIIATGWRQGFRLALDSTPVVADSALVRGLGEMVETLGRKIQKLNPNWGYQLRSSDYVNELAMLVNSILNQASGVPTGAHGAFRDYQVDAVTLYLSTNKKTQVDALEKLGRLLELVVRSVNNLLEKLHHSLFLYVMASANKFVAVSVYMIPVVLILVIFPLEAASQVSSNSANEKQAALDNPAGKPDAPQNNNLEDGALKTVVENTQPSIGNQIGWHGLPVQPLLIALVIHLWSILVAVLPLLIHSALNPSAVRSLISSCKYSDEDLKLVIWTSLAALSLWVSLQLISRVIKSCGYSETGTAYTEDKCWRILKGFLLAAATIGLVVMSVLNYAVALVGAIALVPMCMTASPLRRTWKQIRNGGGSWGSAVILILRNVLTILASPVGLAVVSRTLFGFPADLNIGVLWRVTEFLWSWGSGLYLYALLVHLPCTVLSFYILFMPVS